jgi:hypothetical protein
MLNIPVPTGSPWFWLVLLGLAAMLIVIEKVSDWLHRGNRKPVMWFDQTMLVLLVPVALAIYFWTR